MEGARPPPLPLWLRHNGELSVSFVRSRKDTTEIMKTALEEKRQQSWEEKHGIPHTLLVFASKTNLSFYILKKLFQYQKIDKFYFG